MRVKVNEVIYEDTRFIGIRDGKAWFERCRDGESHVFFIPLSEIDTLHGT